MQVEKIISRAKYALTLLFDNGEVRLADYSGNISKWFSSKNKDLMKIAETFDTAFVRDGSVCFKCGLSFDADDIYEHSELIERRAIEKRVRPQQRHVLGTVSSKEVEKAQKNGLPFTGEWKEFLGEPARNFMMITSASPGHGKTTFSLKFANYLTKFGRVVYITNEEDASRIKGKFDFIGDKIKDFDMSFDCKSIDDIIDLIRRGKYNFVFIDSVQFGGMDTKELRRIRETFPNIAIDAICRQTKSGKTRGSQDKEYDGDITLTFYAPGRAKTIKNRFWELREYCLFGEPEIDEDDLY